jgi:hypothetical protein
VLDWAPHWASCCRDLFCEKISLSGFDEIKRFEQSISPSKQRAGRWSPFCAFARSHSVLPITFMALPGSDSNPIFGPQSSGVYPALSFSAISEARARPVWRPWLPVTFTKARAKSLCWFSVSSLPLLLSFFYRASLGERWRNTRRSQSHLER